MVKKREDIELKTVTYYVRDNEEILGVVLAGAMFHCTKCKALKPAHSFGLRMTADNVVRNQAQCSSCRSGGSKKGKEDES